MNSKPLNKQDLTNEIKAEALRLGFFACGIARAEHVDKTTTDHINRWLKEGKFANLTFFDAPNLEYILYFFATNLVSDVFIKGERVVEDSVVKIK